MRWRSTTGNDWFQPSNIEFTDIEVGNGATNVIPASARARLSIRFNDQHKGADLVALIERLAHDVEPERQSPRQDFGRSLPHPAGRICRLWLPRRSVPRPTRPPKCQRPAARRMRASCTHFAPSSNSG